MCRLYGFRSMVLSGVHHSLVAAENALAQQSVRHPDGWGVAYYHSRFPQVIRSEKQALDDSLFSDVSGVVSTHTLLAHIRQATYGDVNVLNCHPFQHGPWTFAHNGEITGFEHHREAVWSLVDRRFRRHVLGTTDSEVCFKIFLSRLARHVDGVYSASVRLEDALLALRETVESVNERTDTNADKPNLLTFMVTNGSLFLAYRHKRPLYFSTHKTLCPERHSCPAFDAGMCEAPVFAGPVNHLIATSERIAEGPNVWTELADGEFVAVDFTMNFRRGWLADIR